MIYISEDRKKCLIEETDVKDISAIIKDISYTEGYLISTVMNNSLNDNSVEVLYHLSENCLKKIEEYKKFPENLRVISNNPLSKLEKLSEIFTSNKKAAEKFEEAKKLISS